jgi:hypothetical protein
MSDFDGQAYLKQIEDVFNSRTSIIDLSDSQSVISQDSAESNSELVRFAFLDEDGPWSEFKKKGLKSLRYGFYKIDSVPYYNNSIYPGTFAATVLYLHPKNKRLIKYNCNIGPMTNIYKIYKALQGSPNNINLLPILYKFEHDKVSIGRPSDDYMVPKRNFFSSIYDQGIIFLIKESIWHPNYPNMDPRPKQVTWSFLKPH